MINMYKKRNFNVCVLCLTHTHSLRYPSVRSCELDISSLQHSSKDSYNPMLTYGASKLCNVLFAMEVHRRYSSRGISCNAVHPGNLLPTQLMRNAGCLYKATGLVARLFTSSVVSSCYYIHDADLGTSY